MKIIGVFLLTMLLVQSITAGPMAAGICYAGCAGIVCACFSAAGFTFGTVPGSVIAATPVLAACNGAFGICMAKCMVALALPTP
jgi:hypothetical protein